MDTLNSIYTFCAFRPSDRGFIDGFSLRVLAALMSLVTAVAPSLSFAQSVPPGVTQIVPDGRTQTTVTTHSSVSTVTTNTVSGPNAFNSFSQFKIGAGNTGNLILPNGTSNLINLMNSNDPAVINGILNSYKDGQIGGNVYFAAPGGFVVGRSGVVNVGSLNVTTPTREFVDGVISSSGQINQGSVNNLLAGTVPLSPDGNIRVRGRVNAIDAVRLTGQNVFVGNNREAINRAQATNFASTVNSKGLRSANTIVVRNGSIQIVAADKARISGGMTTASRTKDGGNIAVTARDIKISEKAKLSAASRDGNAGQILVYATDQLEVKSGAQVDVSSAKGNGGFVDLSAKNVVTLGAINFKLAAPNGVAGTVLVDPADIIITGDGQNYQTGNSLYSAGGNIILTASDSITVTSSGVIDSRNIADHSSLASATNPSLGNSGNITLNAPTIKIFGKILADVYNTNGNTYTAGDVTLNAVSSVNIVAGLATANTLIQIGSGAQIWGKNITLNSNAEAISSYTDSAAGIAALIGQSVAAAAIGLNGGYVAGTATSTVTVENNTTINGSGNVTISSSAKEKAVDPAVSIGGASPVTVAVTVGEINGTVNTTVKSGANISAGGNLNITAQNDAALNVIAIGLSTDSQAAVTVAYGTANVQTSAIVESGANLVVGGNLYLGARNINSFSVSATSYSLGQSGKAGAAVAYSEINTAATATLGANIGNATTSIPGSVTVEANSGMPNSSSDATNTTSATAAAGNPILIDKVAQAGASAVGKAFDDFVVVKAPASTVTDLKLAGALSLASSDQSATASIAATAGGTAPSIYSAGNVAVIAKVSDVGVSSLADASTNSQEVGDRTAPSTQSAAKTGVSLGVAVGTYGHHANAFIGQGVTVCCGNLGVSATTEMPITINWLTYDSLGTWLAKLNGNLGVVNQVLTSYANAASQAQDSTRVGAANYFEVDNTATAWVASNATITRNSATAPATWSTTLADGSSLAWDQAIAVQAATRTASIDIGGNFSWLGLTGSSGQQNGNGQSQAEAIGGATNVVIYNNRTYAGISDGVTINSNGALGVSAKNENAIVAVSPTSGAGNAESYNGIVAVAIVDDVAHASIANSAKISATAVDINANEALSVFAVGGAVASAQTDAVGIVIAVNQITGSTAAYIGDNRADITGSRDASNDPGSASAAAGYVNADDLQLQAQTYGVVTAASVAATKASGSPSTGSTFLNKFITAVQTLRGKVDSAGSKGDAAAGGATPKLSIDVAGSSSVNVSAMTTDAYIDGAVIGKKSATNATSVQAVNNTILQTGAGSAALDMAKVQGSKSAAIAGALAISLSGNATRAYVNDSQISGASAFSALALSGGEETTVALGLALNQSADQTKAASVAGSVSIAGITDFVAASVVNSTVAADSSITPTYGSNSATVAAYQTTDVAIGGGSLYKGGKTGFGFAITYVEIVDPDGGKAVDARVSNSSITGFYNASVSASDASRIGAGAGLFGQAQNALAVSMVISEISPTISAVVDGGSTIAVTGTQQSYQKTTSYYVASTQDLTDTASIDYTLIYQIGSYRTYSVVRTDTVQVTSDVTVSSNGARNSTFDAAIANASQVGATPVNSGLVDFSGSALEAANAQSGASIIAVAGVVQGGQNSLGFAITANTIHQNNIAQITHANVTAKQGDVIVTADSSADILGLAVGAALSQGQGKFAGLNSTAINQINNAVSATIGDATATTTNTKIDTTDVVVRATDGSNIRGAAGTLAIGTNGSAAGLSIVYDKIANVVVAGIDGAKVTASGDVMINAASDAAILTVALGIAVSKQVGVAGSVAVSLLNTNVTASVTGGADISATNNVGVLARNYDVISVVSGAAGIGATSTGVGISVVVNEIGGATSAFISGPNTQVDAYAAGSASMLVNSGTLNNAFDVSAADSPNLTPPDLSEQQRSVHGLAVVATSHQAVDGVAVTLGLAAGASAFAINPETTLLGGRTLAYIDGAQIDTRAPTSPRNSTGQGIFVGASSQTYARSLLLSVAASGGSGAGAVAVAATRFDRETYAYITNSNVGTSSRRIGDVAINASSTQVAQYTAVGAAVSGSAFGGSMIVNVFEADTQAYLTHGSLYASSLGVTATSQNGQNASAGAGAASASTGVAASFVIGASENNTLAYIGDNSAFTTVDLAGALSVTATSHNTFYSLAAGGTGAGGNGIAGMVDFTVLTDTTKAIINNTSVTQTGVGSGVTVSANEDVTVRVTTGSGALGGSFGIGAAINVVVLKSQIAGAIIDSDVSTPGAVAVTATGTKDIDMQAITFGIGGTAGLAGAISLLIAGINAPGDAVNQIGATIVVIDNEISNVGADNGIAQSNVPGNIDTAGSRPADYSLANALNGGNDAVSAEVTRGTTTAGSVNVSASGSVKTKNLATGVGIGGVAGVGAALAFSLVYDTIAASVSHGVVHASNVTVNASMQDNGGRAVEVDAYAGAGGAAAAIGAAIAIGTVNNTVSAQLGGTIIGPDAAGATAVSLSASDSSSIYTNAVGASIATDGMALGASIATTTKSSLIYAAVLNGASISGYSGMTVTAAGSGSLGADSAAGAGGVFAGSGAISTATDHENVIAEIGTVAANAAIGAPASTASAPSITVGAQGLYVHATSTPDVDTSAIGVAVGAAGVGASVSTSTVNATVNALVDPYSSITTQAITSGTPAVISVGQLKVIAEMLLPSSGTSAHAFSAAGTGGFVIGANATVSTATNNATVHAAIGDHVLLPMGDVIVQANSSTSQSAVTTGIAVGFVGLGVAVALATADTNTTAELGQSVTSSGSRTGNLLVNATSKDAVSADATSGVGGVIAGNGAGANTTVNSSTTVNIGQDSNFTAGTIGLVAWHTSTYKGSVNTVNASLAGASGAAAVNDITSDVSVNIRKNVQMTALMNVCGSSTCAAAVNVVAQNDFVESGTGDTATGAGGGVLNGAAVFGVTHINGTASILIDDSDDTARQTIITAGTDPFYNPGGIRMTAFSTLNATDTVSLVTGGAITSAGVNTTVDATLSNSVTVGNYARLQTFGSIGIGTFTQAAINTGAYVSTYGIAAVGSAAAYVYLTDKETVTIKDNATLTAFGNVNLTPGQDPGGNYQSVLMVGTSDAQAYVRGLIAIPVATGETKLTTSADLSIGAGSYIGAGQNVTLGAYEGTQNPVSHGDAHGYILFLIPVTTSDSSARSVQSSSVTISSGANVVAGQYHDQEIVIDCGATACGPNSTPTVRFVSGALPAVVGYTSPGSLFDVAAYVNAAYDPDVKAVLLSSISGTPVPAFRISPLFASGGSVAINARTIDGTGTVTAYGSPKINVTANSPAYLIFDGAYIPDIVGGQVLFTGAATEGSKPASMTINRVAGDGASTITLVNNYTGNTGSTGVGPAMLFAGDVTNLGGTITISNLGGSYGSIANTNAQGIELNVPNGAAVISNPGPGGYYGPINAFGGFDDLAVQYPGGTPSGGTAGANIGAEYVANILFQPLVGNGAGQFPDLTAAAYGFLNAGSDHFFPGTSNAKTSTLFFSNCLPGISGGCATSNYVGNFEGNNYVYAPDGRYLLGNLGGAAYLYAPITFRSLTYSTNGAALPASSLVQTFGGGNVAIKAAIIDVNAKIVVGRPADQSVIIPASVQATLSTYRQQYLSRVGAGGAPNPIYNIPGLLTPTEAATRGVGTAVYDAANDRIIVTDTNASSSGGRLTMNGAIISTSAFGNIEVNGGLGQVTIDNQTSIPMVVNKVNTGNLGADGTVVSTVKITDTLRPVATNTTTYRYTAGQGVLTYVTGNGDDPILSGPNATPVSPLNASGLVQYNPATGARLQWVQQAQLTRALTENGAGQWSWVTSADQPNNPWFFVTADALTNPNYSATQMTTVNGTNLVSQAHPQGVIILPGSAAYPNTSAQFTQTITGGVTTQTSSTQDYHFSGFSLVGLAAFAATSATGHSGDSDDTTHTFNLPTELWLKVTSSVKADNAFNVTFKGGTVGSVNISSNSAVTLADQLTNSSGQTRITAAGSITQGGDAFVRSKSLILDATGGQGAAASNTTSGIGTAARPFAATMNGGVVNAQAGVDGIYMRLSGTSSVGKIAAVDARGYGDVSYTKSGDILAAGGADAVPINFIGSNITLNSVGGQVGTLAAPIVLSANSKLDQNQIVTGGVVNISAQGDINITQTGVNPSQPLDLRLGTLASLSGDVNVTVINGALVDARGQTSASALSPGQVDAIAQLLHLTSATGAGQAAIDRSVKPFEASITNNYSRYFRLKSDACTTGCSVFVVPASAIQLYRPLAAAALQSASLTDAQVADYITTLHQTNGTLNLSDTALALYRPLAQAALGVASVTDDQVRAYADSQYQGIVQNFQRAYGAGWASLSQFTTQRANFVFSVNDADAAPGLQASLTARAVWDPAQLIAGIDQTAFQPVSPTVGNGTPNIIGRDVTLNVGGSLGVLAAPVPIALSSLVDGGNGLSLTAQQKAAIAAANTPGSVVPVGVDGNGATVKGFSLSSIPSGVTVTGVEINQQAPIFVAASRTFNASATATAFVQSTGSSDFKIGQVVAAGDVALTATRNLVAALDNNGAPQFAQQVITNGNLSLTAGNGDIGFSGLAFSYKADGHLTAAQASGNVYVASYGATSGSGGDMIVGRVFASGTASLTAMTGDIQGYLGGLAITGHDVVLNAVAGSIGAANSPLQVQTNGGQLTATASFGDVYLFSPTVTGQVPVPLSIAMIAANGAIVVTADVDLTAQSLVSAIGDITVGSGGRVKVVSAVTSLQGGNGAITVTALGDIEVGSLTAPGPVKAQAVGAFTLDAGGALTSSNAAVDLRAATVTMLADTMLWAATDLSVTATGDASLLRLVAGGDVTIASGGSVTVADASTSGANGNGTMTVTAAQNLSLGTFAARGLLRAQAGGAMALAAGGLLASSQDAVDVAASTLTMGSNSVLSAARTVAVVTTGDAILGKLVSQLAPASPNTTAISVTAGDAGHEGHIIGNGDGQLNFATQRPNAAVVLFSASGIGTQARPLTMDANWLSAIATTGEIHIAALGSIHVKTVSAPGGIDLTAPGSVIFDEVKGESLILKSNGALELNNVEVTTSLTLSGTSITGNIFQTPGAPGPLIVSITGPNGTVARNVSLVINPPSTVVPQLLAVDATITHVGPSFTILNGYISGQFTLNMLGQTYVMNNRSPAPMGWPTVQLYQLNGTPFRFSQNGNYTVTSGFVVDYGLLANTTALSVFNGISLVRDVPRDMWNGNPFEQDDGAEKKGSTARIWGATPSAVLDGLKLPKAVETIGEGPAVNIEGLR